MALVKQFGEMWARNTPNINKVPGSKKGGQGVYVLYDGSMPMYVGMGNIRSRIRTARRSKSRGQMWDHFSWFVLSNKTLMHDVEALLLRTLPPCLRHLNRQNGKLKGKQAQSEKIADSINRMTAKRKK